jgi:hypothetical protein
VQEPPPVTITDPSRRSAPRAAGPPDAVGADPADDGERPSCLPAVPRRLQGWGGLLAAVLAGVALAQLLPSGDPAPQPVGPRLALVVGGQPLLDAVPGPDPSLSVEVSLVNTGPEPVRLTGAVAPALGLRGSADEVLGAGEQTVLVLREGNACARIAQEPRGSRGSQELRVAVGAPSDDLPDEVVLSLPLSVVRRYDDFARSFCGVPHIAEGLDVRTEPQSVRDGTVLIPVGLVSQTVQRLRLVEVAGTVPGLTVGLWDDTGAAVPLPLEIPGRYLVDLDVGFGPGVPEVDQYVVRVHLGQDGCDRLGDAVGRNSTLVQLFWAAEDEPARIAAATIGDLHEATRLACH